MSEKASFFSPSCKLEFEFRSRYLRHLKVAGYKAYLEYKNSVVLVPPHVQPTDCGSTAPDANSLDIGSSATEGESCTSK